MEIVLQQIPSLKCSSIRAFLYSGIWSPFDLTNTHKERMQQVQDNYFMNVFQVAKNSTPKCMVRLDSQTLQVKWQILLRKIKQVRKTMDK